MEFVTGAGRPEPNGEVAAGLSGKARAHFHADDLLKRVKRRDHYYAAHTGAQIEEGVSPQWRIRGGQEGAPGIDSGADNGGRTGRVANIVEIVRMTRTKQAALNAGGCMDAMLEVEGMGLETAGPHHAIAANGIVAEAAEEAAIPE